MADDSEHRRGLILGLTMAEIMLLFLFLLLLGLGHLLSEQNSKMEQLETQRDAALRQAGNLKPILDALNEKMPSAMNGVDELIKKLDAYERLENKSKDQDAESAKLKSELAELKQIVEKSENASRDARAIADQATKINPDDPPAITLKRSLDILAKVGVGTTLEMIESTASIARENVELKAKNEGLLGESNQFRMQRDALMRRQGRGIDYPPCWPTEGGKFDYTFDVTMVEAGYIVRDMAPANRMDGEEMRLVSSFPRDKIVSLEQFRNNLAPLHQWSVKKECRFYVIIRDGTRSNDKQLYTKLNSQVEGFFYISRRSASAQHIQAAKPEAPNVTNPEKPSSSQPTTSTENLLWPWARRD